MKKLIFLLYTLVINPAFATLSTGHIILAKITGSGSNTEVTVTHTVDTFKSPSMSIAPRTTFNTGTPIQIDDDILGENYTDVNHGIGTKPELQSPGR